MSTYRVFTYLAITLGVGFAGLGALRLVPIETDQQMFIDWGLPMWLRAGAAISQLLAGVLTLIPRTRSVGAVGIFTIMVAAGTVHAVIGHHMAWPTLYNGLPALAAAGVAWVFRGDLPALGTRPRTPANNLESSPAG